METFFYRVHFIGVDCDNESELIQKLIENGATGSSESLSFSQPDLTFDPRVFRYRKKNVDVFFTDEPNSQLLSTVKNDFQIESYQVFKEEHKDWLTEWKKGYTPFLLTQPFWIVPSWLESPVSPEHTLRIDPGMAFGTGTHATTQMAAHLVKQALTVFKLPSTETLDVGAGTGVLSILASKLGASLVTAIDVDPECLRVSKENCQLNQCDRVLVEATDLENIGSQFDLVIANIIDGILIRLSSDLVRVTKPNGLLVLSGILLENEDRILDTFVEDHNLKIESRLEKEGWVSFLARRP